MKKNLFWAALVGVALAGCVNDESLSVEEQQQLVAFDNPLFKTQSRAQNGEILGAYPTTENFKVFCRRYSGNFSTWLAEGSKDYFNNNQNTNETLPVEMTNNGSVWLPKNGTMYYWPGTGYSLAFAAFSPADAVGTITYSSNGLSIVDFSTETNSDNQYDLLYSDRVVDCTNENYGKVNKSVPLKFRHALASIVFAASANQPNRTYRIDGIKVVGKFATKGDFNENINEATSSVAPEWINLTDKDDNSPVNIETTYTPNFTPTSIGAGMTIFTAEEHALLLIPQTVPTGAYILLSYTVTPTSGTETTYENIKIDLDLFKKTDNAPISSWERNHRYIYQIEFGGSMPISFSPSVEGWEPDVVATHVLTH